MTYRYINLVHKEIDTAITEVRYWYDRSLRLWIVTDHNKAGDQIGEADYPYGKRYAIEVARRRAASHPNATLVHEH